MSREVITFLRQRDYKYIKDLGQGGCGKTVLLLDDVIDEHFVCKKYAPADSVLKEQLYESFMNEIKLMHKAFHLNIVRIFSYYTFPRQLSGYILMEYVEGETIDKYCKGAPNDLSSVFRQTIDAFCYLEACGILHRDIRFGNILVRNDGVVKVIDLGFGKYVSEGAGFNKSITLNWAAPSPQEFLRGKYDFGTEIYFVGKLFERIMEDNSILDEPLYAIVRKMCAMDPRQRWSKFNQIKLQFDQAELSEPEFDEEEISTYRRFAEALVSGIVEIELKAVNIADINQVIQRLEMTHRNNMLEEGVAAHHVVSCFIDGDTRVYKNSSIPLSELKKFTKLLKRRNTEEQKIILANLFGRLNLIERWDEDEIPF